MIINPYRFGDNGRRLFLVIGDSTAAGSGGSGGTIPTPSTSSGIEWYNGAYGAVGTLGNLSNISPWPSFIQEYAANMGGLYPVICNRGVGGSTFHDFGGGNTNNWALAGANYTTAIADANAMCSNEGKTLTAIFIMLGINDARAWTSGNQSAISAAIDSLVTRLHTAFPSVPIVFNQIGRLESPTAYLTNGVSILRTLIKNKVIADSLCYFGASYLPLQGAGLYMADLIHANNDGCNYVGASFARWCLNSSLSKWGRAVVSSHFDYLSSGRKTLIDTFLSGFNFVDFDMLYNFKTTTKNNAFLDWSFNNGPSADGGFTFNTNTDIVVNGTSVLFRTGFDILISQHGTATTTCAFGNKTGGTVTTPGPTPDRSIAMNFGGSCLWGLRNNGTVTGYMYSTNGISLSDTTYAINTDYCVHSFGGTISMIKNGSSITSGARSGTPTPSSIEVALGCRVNAPSTLLEGINTTLVRSYIMAGGVSVSGFNTAFNTLQSGW